MRVYRDMLGHQSWTAILLLSLHQVRAPLYLGGSLAAGGGRTAAYLLVAPDAGAAGSAGVSAADAGAVRRTGSPPLPEGATSVSSRLPTASLIELESSIATDLTIACAACSGRRTCCFQHPQSTNTDLKVKYLLSWEKLQAERKHTSFSNQAHLRLSTCHRPLTIGRTLHSRLRAASSQHPLRKSVGKGL